jgi:hypothetical protein
MSAKKVFISYNHEDRLVADKLKSALEGEGIIVTIDNAALLRAAGKESEAEKLENRASIIKAKYSHQDSEG